MTVYEQLIAKGFPEKYQEYEMLGAAQRFTDSNELFLLRDKVQQELEEIVSEIDFG